MNIIKKFIPVGMDLSVVCIEIGSLIILTFINIMNFYREVEIEYQILFVNGKDGAIKPGAKMMTEEFFIDKLTTIFVVCILISIGLSVYFYNYHLQGSKSIYTMRRLPQKNQFNIRCFTVPIVEIVLISAVHLIAIYIFLSWYENNVPLECIIGGI